MSNLRWGFAGGSDPRLADLVVERPALAGLFDRLGLDFCCRGELTLTQACQATGVSLGNVLDGMDATAGRDEMIADWGRMGAEELADHIELVHHAWLHRELPLLEPLAAKVLSVHRRRHPELQGVLELVQELVGDLVPHLAEEEQVLFPASRLLARGFAGFSFGSVAGPIAALKAEHETVGDLLTKLRSGTGNYEPPEDACASYRLLYLRLGELEADTHLHVFKEHSLLFPMAASLEPSADRRLPARKP